MKDTGADNPYKTLGWHLKFAREQKKESLAEVSGAVEIEMESLQSIEQGKSRPTEDVLLLLINHFGIEDLEASSLWELAGYLSHVDIGQSDEKQVTVAMPADLRIIYTDMVHVMVNDYGVVMNFMQGGGPANQPMAVARVGMSKTHAKSVLAILQKTLEQSEIKAVPKHLPSPKSKKRTNK